MSALAFFGVQIQPPALPRLGGYICPGARDISNAVVGVAKVLSADLLFKSLSGRLSGVCQAQACELPENTA